MMNRMRASQVQTQTNKEVIKDELTELDGYLPILSTMLPRTILATVRS